MRRWLKRSAFLVSGFLLAFSSLSGAMSANASEQSTTVAALSAEYNYAEALQKSIYFYEAQQSGVLPAFNRVEWRGDSALQDGADVGYDLTGGWYDAGDHVKFGFPMAATATMLAWSVYEYKEGYEKTGQLDAILDNLRFVNDYFMKAHTAPNELWGQVGNGNADHNWWGPAEVMPMARPAYKIDTTKPGSDLAAETAAALASASIIFKESDPTYSSELLRHAKELYQFADQYRGKYSDSITDAQQFYNSWSGYADELSWGAVWLYLATEEQTYLDKAIAASNLWGTDQSGQWDYKWTHAWDDKHYGAQLLLARITNDSRFVESTKRNMEYWTTGVTGTNERVTYTPGGLAHLDQWGALRYSANQSFLAFVYSDWVNDPVMKQTTRQFAESQIRYMLGDNPRNSSYVIGFGNNSPQHPHHRTSHGSWADSQSVPAAHRHILYGALVGGPGSNDSYTDSISDYVSNEVATDYNAGFTGALAKMAILYGDGQLPLANFPQPEVRDDEMFVEASVNASGNNFIEIRALLNNRSGWPARASEAMSFRYFVDLTELVQAGYGPQDVTVTTNYNQGATVSSLLPYDVSGNIYYVNVDFTGTRIYPGGQSAYRKEIQFRIAAPTNTNVWDNANDFSYQGLASQGSTPSKTPYIAVYDGNQHVFGQLPSGEGNPGQPSLPAQPQQVAVAAGDGQLTLSWNNVYGADSYIVKRAIASSGPYTTVATTTGTTYLDTGLSNGTTYYYTVTASNAAGEGSASSVVSGKPREAEAPVDLGVTVHYKTTDTNPLDNQIRAQFKVINNSNQTLDLSKLKIRYYYTIDGDKAQQFHCDYAWLGSGSITGSFLSMNPAAVGADYYFEVGFGSNAGTLAPGSDTGDIQTRINKIDWSNYNENDDYSYEAAAQNYAEWNKVTLHYDGQLIFGNTP